MSNRNSELMKNTVILAIGQIVPKFVAIFVLPLLTTYLTQRDYGLYELTLSVASFCIPLLSVQIQQGVFRFLLDLEYKKNEIITSSLLFIVTIFIFSAIPLVFCWYIYTKDITLSILFFGSYFTEVILTWIGQVSRGLGYNFYYSVAYILYSIIYILILIILLVLTKVLTAKDVALAMIGAYIFAALFLLTKSRIRKYIGTKWFNGKTLIALLSYSAPMVISSIALWIVNLSDRFFVSAFLGIEETAMYSVANRIPNLFNSIYNIFNLAWTENTSKLSLKEKEEGYYTIFFKEFYQVMVGMMLVLITVSPLLFKILINNKYSEAYGLMSWLYVGVFFSSLVAFFGSIYVGEKKTKNVGISSAIGAFINVAINFVLMKRYGVIIAAISTIVSYLIICIYRAIDVKKYVLIKYNPTIIVSGLFIICALAAMNNTYSRTLTVISLFISISYNFIFNRNIISKIIFASMRKGKYDV